LLVAYLNEHPTIRNLGLLLEIYTGIRVGELSSLKPADNQKRGYLNICRTECKYFDTESQKSHIGVKEFPKTEKSVREILLPEKAQEILDYLKNHIGNSEYLLSEKGKRITSRQFNYQLEKTCKIIGIIPRSTHKIRRSYASKLLSEKVDTAIVQNQLGHEQISTTQNYYHYEIASDSSKFDVINSAIDY
jgi:integrase